MDAITNMDTEGVTEIYFPSGTYKISSPIEIRDIEKIILRGDGSNLTHLIFNLDNDDKKANISIKYSEIIEIVLVLHFFCCTVCNYF